MIADGFVKDFERFTLNRRLKGLKKRFGMALELLEEVSSLYAERGDFGRASNLAAFFDAHLGGLIDGMDDYLQQLPRNTILLTQ